MKKGFSTFFLADCIISAMQTPTERSNSIGTADGLSSVFSIISDELSQVTELIERELSDCSREVRDFTGYVATGKGKMIRPGLLLLSGRACGEITENHIHAAAIIELIHNATLLHDDVVDQGTTRRGEATLNHICGNESAVLLGDFLLSRVFRLCLKLDTKARETLASSVIKTCEGELRQTAQKGNQQLTEAQYLDIITDKTSALFNCACTLGALLSEGSESQVKMLADYGHNAGIAFQITDDLLDLTGAETGTGKTTGNDLEHDKLTLPLIYFFSSAGEKEKANAIKLIDQKKTGEKGTIVSLTKMMRDTGSIDYAQKRAEDFVKQAIESLRGIKMSEWKTALIETARSIAGRTA